MKSRFFAAAAAILFALGSATAVAQTPPAAPTLPPSTNPILQTVIDAVARRIKSDYGWEPNRARGVVTYFRRFDMQIRFANGTYRDVHLHQGTVINPRGATPDVGSRVDVQGQMNTDGSLNANVITLY
jgi:hypothetical protein